MRRHLRRRPHRPHLSGHLLLCGRGHLLLRSGQHLHLWHLLRHADLLHLRDRAVAWLHLEGRRHLRHLLLHQLQVGHLRHGLVHSRHGKRRRRALRLGHRAGVAYHQVTPSPAFHVLPENGGA